MPENSPNGTLLPGVGTAEHGSTENQLPIPPTRTIIKYTIGARQRGTTGILGGEFGKNKIFHMHGIIHQFIYLCKEEWDSRLVEHENTFTQTSRTVESFRRKFRSLNRRKMTTEDPLISANVEHAKKIWYSVTERGYMGLMDDQGEELLPPSNCLIADDDELENFSKDVDCVPPAVRNEPSDVAEYFALTGATNVTFAALPSELQACAHSSIFKRLDRLSTVGAAKQNRENETTLCQF